VDDPLLGEIRRFGFEEGRQWLRSMLEKQWQALVEPVKELVREQYAATLDLLSK
jgi:hypothetical protein